MFVESKLANFFLTKVRVLHFNFLSNICIKNYVNKLIYSTKKAYNDFNKSMKNAYTDRHSTHRHSTTFKTGIYRDNTMADKIMYIPNGDTQNYLLCRLHLKLATFGHSTYLTNQSKIDKSS